MLNLLIKKLIVQLQDTIKNKLKYTIYKNFNIFILNKILI